MNELQSLLILRPSSLGTRSSRAVWQSYHIYRVLSSCKWRKRRTPLLLTRQLESRKLSLDVFFCILCTTYSWVHPLLHPPQSSSYVIMGRTSRRSLMVPGPFSGENTYFYQDLVTLACACVSSSPLRWKTPHEGKLEKLRPQRRGSRYLPRSIAAAVYWFNDVNCRYFVFIGGGSGQRWGWWLESPNNIR